jgi:hypothetical protein
MESQVGFFILSTKANPAKEDIPNCGLHEPICFPGIVNFNISRFTGQMG